MKNIKKSLRSVFCALLAAAALAASLPAYAVSQAEIDDLQKKLDALEQQAQEQQDVINDLTSQKARFITRKLALDNKIEINRQMIELIGEQIEIYDEIIAEKQAELDKALEKETAQTELLRSRIRAMEENSTYSYASFIFDSSSVTELLSRIGDVNDIMHYDKTLEEEYMAAREDVESIKKSYEEARHEQELLQKELDTKQAELDAQVEAAYTMIADIETLSDDAQAEYDAIAEEEAKAEETLQEAIRKRAAEQAKYNQNNNSNNGGGGNSGGSGGNSGGGSSSGGSGGGSSAKYVSVSFIGSGADDAVGRKTTRRGSDYTFRIDRKDDTDYDVSARVNGVTVKCTYDSKKNIYRISGSEVTGDITITITKGAPVEVNVYVTLDKQSMYLVTYSGSVEDGHVPMYDGQNMYWSEAYNAYAWLVISSADEKEVVRTARNSIIIGEGEAAASIDYSGNVDLSGRIDVDDVHLDHDVYNARYTLVSMVMHKFLNADVNRDRKVDVKDAVWIVNRILSGQQGA